MLRLFFDDNTVVDSWRPSCTSLEEFMNIVEHFTQLHPGGYSPLLPCEPDAQEFEVVRPVPEEVKQLIKKKDGAQCKLYEVGIGRREVALRRGLKESVVSILIARMTTRHGLTLREFLQFLKFTRVKYLCLLLYPVMLRQPLLQVGLRGKPRYLQSGGTYRIQADEHLDWRQLF